MTTIEVIYKISTSDCDNIVIKDEGDRTPMQAIERLSSNFYAEKDYNWKYNNTLEKNTLLIY